MSGPRSHAATNTEADAPARAWLKPQQVERLRDACLDSEVPTYLQDRNEAIVAVLYDTGLRRGELVALDVENYDRDDRVLRVPPSVQKGNKTAPADLKLGKYGADSKRALDRYLRDRWKDTAALFPSRQSDRMSGRAVKNVVRAAAERAGVRPYLADGGRGEPTDVGAHTLRHSVAYRIIRERGGRMEDVQLRLRHANRSTTDRVYGHLRER